ncbi:hypothetical protein DL95DRAFT_511590 [Leptodontidium sp. 2 PMI_412]|nr:hypothetical protein DL95DRAFT_511590 [Leptodontidium sp. 2 PMI_412]
MAFFPQYLTAGEEARIHQQFQGELWRRNNQVLWSGILREEAQRWADEHDMQTLTTAMGPLMDLSHPLCLRNQKSSKAAWSKYVEGASAIFAWYISRGERVTVLSPPPPERFHPSGEARYQVIEEPIVKGKLGTSAVSRIEMVHPTVKGAENICYQIWPVDETTSWTARFGELNVQRRSWRMVKRVKTLSNKLGGTEITKVTQHYDVEHGPTSPYQETKEEAEKKREEEERKKKMEKEEEKKKAKQEMKKTIKEERKKAKKVIKERKKAEKEENMTKEEKEREEEERKKRMEKKEMKKTAKEERKKAKEERKKAKKEENTTKEDRAKKQEELKQYPEKVATEENDGWLA